MCQNGQAEIIMGLGSYRWYHCTSMNYGIASSIPLASWHSAEVDLQVRHAAANSRNVGMLKCYAGISLF
jgi:hypothetical protein